jgi:hypothetical protein
MLSTISTPSAGRLYDRTQVEDSPHLGQVEALEESPGATAKVASRPTASKQSTCLALLQRPEGAIIGELQEITGWHAHSVRGFLAGTVKKKLGLDITSTKDERGRVYRIASGQEAV